jgi:biotin carboxyl carrier protein
MEVKEVNPMEGEFPMLADVVVVSPGHGRFQQESIEAGNALESGAILGVIRDGGPDVPVRSPISGVFLAWLTWGGERVAPGVPLASIARESA